VLTATANEIKEEMILPCNLRLFKEESSVYLQMFSWETGREETNWKT